MPSRLSLWAARWDIDFRTKYPHLIRQLLPFLKQLEELLASDEEHFRKEMPSLVAFISFMYHAGEAVLQNALELMSKYPGKPLYRLSVFMGWEFLEIQNCYEEQKSAAAPFTAIVREQAQTEAAYVAAQLQQTRPHAQATSGVAPQCLQPSESSDAPAAAMPPSSPHSQAPTATAPPPSEQDLPTDLPTEAALRAALDNAQKAFDHFQSRSVQAAGATPSVEGGLRRSCRNVS